MTIEQDASSETLISRRINSSIKPFCRRNGTIVSILSSKADMLRAIDEERPLSFSTRCLVSDEIRNIRSYIFLLLHDHGFINGLRV